MSNQENRVQAFIWEKEKDYKSRKDEHTKINDWLRAQPYIKWNETSRRYIIQTELPCMIECQVVNKRIQCFAFLPSDLTESIHEKSIDVQFDYQTGKIRAYKLEGDLINFVQATYTNLPSIE